MRRFNVGDRVVVARKVESQTGWTNTWFTSRSCEGDMNTYIGNGQVYTISEVSMNGVRFKEAYEYGWPTDALELHTPKFIDGTGVSEAEFARRTAAPVELSIEEIQEKLGVFVKIK